ncbi:MAG: YciI family protein [Actinomycetota bacterium]|nr:YciI family protein [Actinomycetota bacterium]
MPQFMLLIYGDPANAPGPEGEQEEQYTEWLNYTNSLVATGTLVSGAPLEGVEAATTVRVRDGATQVSDGPVLDSQEILGGFYLVDVPDRESAIALAERMPNIEYGSVEVRPVVVFPGAG